jgi:hypothetical protein
MVVPIRIRSVRSGGGFGNAIVETAELPDTSSEPGLAGANSMCLILELTKIALSENGGNVGLVGSIRIVDFIDRGSYLCSNRHLTCRGQGLITTNVLTNGLHDSGDRDRSGSLRVSTGKASQTHRTEKQDLELIAREERGDAVCGKHEVILARRALAEILC